MERCGKINAVNSGSESWTGIGVVAGCAVVMLLTQGPHVQDIATYWRIKLLYILQEVGSICKTRNHLLISPSSAGACHGTNPLFLPARARCTGVVLPHALLAVAQRLRCPSPVDR